jgi:aerobic C4-dicarboxylate transport protein
MEAAISAMPSAMAIPRRKQWYINLTIQVLIAMLFGALVGWFFPAVGPALRPFAELFIKMVAHSCFSWSSPASAVWGISSVSAGSG